MKKNISMIGVITGSLLLLSLILSMFYNTTLNPNLNMGYLFVATLPYSQYTYVELMSDMNVSAK